MDKANAKSVQFAAIVFARLTCETLLNRTRAVFLEGRRDVAIWIEWCVRGCRSFGRRHDSVRTKRQRSGGAQDDISR